MEQNRFDMRHWGPPSRAPFWIPTGKMVRPFSFAKYQRHCKGIVCDELFICFYKHFYFSGYEVEYDFAAGFVATVSLPLIS